MATINPAIELRTACDSDRIALRGVRLEATLIGASVRATLEQTFVNLEDKSIEAVYTFPLPEMAAVCAFEVLTGDHVLTAQIEENEAALKRYDDAIIEGHAAYMLEQDRPDVFSARVGNLKPRQAVKIRISYVNQLERVDRSLRIRFPTTIAPRYVSAAGSDDMLQTAIDGDMLNPPHLLAVPYGLEIHAQVKLGGDVERISSPTHAIKVDRADTGTADWSVTFAENHVDLDRDVVLQIELRQGATPDVQVAPGPDDAHYLSVSFVPEFEHESLGEHRPSETVFLLDCSGSMQGDSIQQAAAALELCMRSLSAGDAFNICRFGSTFQLFAKEPVAYSEDTLKRAIRFVHQRPDLGGTEIFTPLSAILSSRPTLGEVRNVVVLTDGQVSNEPAVIELARKWRSTNRLFTFGIGTAASGYLVRNLARVTGGAAEFISGSERIEDKVLRTFSRIGSPAVTDVTVDWGGAEVQTAGEIPPLFDGDVLRVFSRATGVLPPSVTLKCRTSIGPQSWSIPLPPATNDAGAISLAWARAMIQSLEDAAGPLTTRASTSQSTCERQLVNVSKQLGILCSRTSFVAVEHRSLEERNSGMPELRRIPVQLARGWGGIMLGGAASSVVSMAAGVAGSAPMMKVRGRRSLSRALFGSVSASESLGESDEVQSLVDEAPQQPSDNLLRLLALQSAEGWFAEGYSEVLKEAGISMNAWRDEIDHRCSDVIHGATVERERAVATLLVVVMLRRLFADRKAIWRRADAKASRWLSRVVGFDASKLDELAAAVAKLSV